MSEVEQKLTEFQKEFLAQAANPEPLHPELELCMVRPEPDDKLGWTCLKHPLIFAVPYFPNMNRTYNRQFEAKKKALEEYTTEKNWGGYIFMHERPYRFNILNSIKGMMTGQEYWELLSFVWTDSENLWQVGLTKLQKMLSYQKKYRCFFMGGDEQSFLNELPEKIRVFRGHQLHNRHGFSWTIAYNKAQWFAQRFSGSCAGGDLVSSGVVDKADMKGLLMGRGEMEIVVNPRSVKGTHVVQKIQRPPYLETIRDELIDQFALKGRTDHGSGHWEKVERNGIELCKLTPEADPTVVQLFAIFHDSCRQNEHSDPGHGPRAAKLLSKMRAGEQLPWLTDMQFEKLVSAVRKHNGHGPVDDPTIGTCFDSDRLDLLRVGIIPDPKLLSTEAGRKMIGII